MLEGRSDVQLSGVTSKTRILTLGFFLSLTAQTATAQTLTVMTWNLESGGAEPLAIAEQIQEFDGVDLWGFSEVRESAQTDFQRGAGQGEGAFFDGILSTSGNDDRLLIVFDTERFELLGHEELDEINSPGLNHRSPLVAHFRDNETSIEFLFMVNHLARGDEDRRHTQATQLNDWAESQTLPVIAVGDYNFDWDLPDGASRDEGFDNMTADGVFEWVQPDPVVRTQCSEDDHDPSGCRFNSVLDFVFVAGNAQDWPAESDIFVEPGDFPDDHFSSDHRPVGAVFGLAAVAGGPVSQRDQLLARLEALEAELAALRALIEAMPPE